MISADSLMSCDSSQVSQELLQQIKETVLQKTVDGMKEEGTPYVGEDRKLKTRMIKKHIILFNRN